jgi:hypothetical protein
LRRHLPMVLKSDLALARHSFRRAGRVELAPDGGWIVRLRAHLRGRRRHGDPMLFRKRKSRQLRRLFEAAGRGFDLDYLIQRKRASYHAGGAFRLDPCGARPGVTAIEPSTRFRGSPGIRDGFDAASARWRYERARGPAGSNRRRVLNPTRQSSRDSPLIDSCHAYRFPGSSGIGPIETAKETSRAYREGPRRVVPPQTLPRRAAMPLFLARPGGRRAGRQHRRAQEAWYAACSRGPTGLRS